MKNGKRIFNIMQFEYNPLTGENLNFNEEVIKEALTHKTIKEWAYILHDNDRYTEEDEANDLAGGRKAGELKPRHWHIVINCPGKVEISAVAKWFNVPENFVDVPKGWGAFLDCVEYLTHKTEKCEKLGKTPYKDEEVKANFDFRKRLDERAEKRLKYGRDLDTKEQMRYDVMYLGKTLKECQNEDPLLYMRDVDRLKKLRLEYISNQKVPNTRLNYYICGYAGYGKDVASRALARSLYPDIEDDDDICFCVGSKGANFEGYDGQPVIIWSDYRAITLLEELGGRENVFKIFDSHPQNSKVNIKYGSVKLINTVNIVNSVQGYTDFLDGLAGQYIDKKGNLFMAEDKNQSYRRFPMIIPLYKDDLDILLSKYFQGEGPATEYSQWKRIKGSFAKVRLMCKRNEELARKIEGKMLAGVAEKSQELLANEEEMTEEEILKELEGYGEEILDLGQPQTQDEQQKEEIDFTDFDKISKENFFG